MKKWIVVALVVLSGEGLTGCLDMSFREPSVIPSLDCPQGYRKLSDKFTTCPEGKECQTVTDPADPTRTQICVEYTPETEGGDGINCNAGYISVSSYISKSGNSSTELSKCVFEHDMPTEGFELQDDEYMCVEGAVANRYCRLVPEENTESRINILVGQRCESYEANPGTDTLRVHIMDIGQGDAIWVQTPGGQNVLIDGGDGGTFNKTNGGPIVTDYLVNHGFESGSNFDAVFLTHPHSDHFGGFNVIFDTSNAKNPTYTLTNYIDPMDLNDPNPGGKVPESYKTWIDLMKTHVTNPTNIYMPAKDSFDNGEIMPEKFFGPGVTAQYITSRDSYSGDAANSTSIIFKLTYAGRSFLFTGDAEADEEAEAIAAVDDLSAHFFKVCHHGSSSSSSVPFLDAIWPDSIDREQRYALISSGRVKYSGIYIPTEETITRLLNYIPAENLFSTSAGDDGKEENETYRDDNILIVVKPDGSYYACYNGTN